jgi:hypothetical protein
MLVEGAVPAGVHEVVTRVEVIDHIGQVFGGGPLTRSDLMAAASQNGARRDVVDVLGRLPEGRRFTRPHDLWHDLADVPIDR